MTDHRVTELDGGHGVARVKPRLASPALDVDVLTADQVRKLSDEEKGVLVDAKVADVTHFVVGLEKLSRHVGVAFDLAPEVQALPAELRGVVVQPDGSPGERLGVEPAVPQGGVIGRGVVTDPSGVFRLPLPARVADEDRRRIVEQGVDLVVRGANGLERVTRPLPPGGGAAVGEIVLAEERRPLPRGVAGALVDLVDDLEEMPGHNGHEPAGPTFTVELGEDACNIRFDEDKSQRRFPYRVLVRLVEPRVTTVNRTWIPPRVEGVRGLLPVPLFGSGLLNGLGLSSRFVERIPVDRPLSVDGFRDQLIGNAGGTIEVARRVPMAGTLGLGYVLNLAQVWKFDGLSLGNLLYSLPLAPGEQQRIAVSEQAATASVREEELLDVGEQSRARLRQDASTDAVFSSAFVETVRANSSYENEASSSSWGVAGGIGGVLGGAVGALVGGVGASGGGGSSSNSGSTRSALDGARHYTSHAADNMHSSVEREASARRRAQRTAIRLATETDRETVTTKVVTNHNRTRALTLQYWEVLRHFRVMSEVEGVTLVCFVPLDVVRFLAAGQPLKLDPGALGTRSGVLARYGTLHQHADSVQPWLPSRHREGLRLLDDFAANPRADVNLTAPASTVLHFSLTGSFLPFERVWVSARLRSGGALGPVALDGQLTDLTQQAFESRTALLDELKRRRASDEVNMTGALAVPTDLDPSEIVGFQISRSFRTLDYQIKFQIDLFEAIQKVMGGSPFGLASDAVEGIRLSPGELEGLLGGPIVHGFSAKLNNATDITADGMTSRRELPPSPLPVPAMELQPALTYRDVLKIERTLQHVVRNTLTYSKAVWASLTPEERVVLLEGYTIGLPLNGLPADGLTDPSQHVPLLNCVANQVLGYYGNCIILPFSIPAALAPKLGRADGDGDDEGEPLTTGRVQEALTAFHRSAFSPPQSHVALPTRGVLGEAVLGHCPSAERIDLTRFWNWQDSPGDTAPDIAAVGFRGQLDTGALAGPNALTGMPSIVNNLNASDLPAAGALARALMESGADQKDFDTAFLGQDLLKTLGGQTITTAEQARADALGKATSLASEAMKSAVDVYKAKTESAKAAADKAKGDDKAAADKKAAEEKKAADRMAAGVKDMKANAASYLAAADGVADQDTADSLAKSVVAELFGEKVPPLAAVQLFTAFDKEAGGSRTQGSTAFFRALGLL